MIRKENMTKHTLFAFATARGGTFLFFPFWKWKESESATPSNSLILSLGNHIWNDAIFFFFFICKVHVKQKRNEFFFQIMRRSIENFMMVKNMST
jgi:hypothetical protein